MSLSLSRDRSRVLLTLRFALSPSPALFEPIEEGLKSRVVYTLLVMEKREGFFSFLGDILRSETTVEYVGYKDFYENVYVREEATGVKTVFARQEDFFRALTSLDNFPVAVPAGGTGSLYLRTQVKYYPIRLVAPLTLIYLIASPGVLESEWRTAPLP